MQLVKVKQEFFEICDKHNVGGQLMQTKGGRPSVLIVQLKYKGKRRNFVVPLRSNIPPVAEEWEFKKLPPNKNTRSGNHHGIHYIKIFPIHKKYIDKYYIDGNKFLETVNRIINKNEKEIVVSCQEYLKRYEKGDRHKFSVDIDAIIKVLEREDQNIDK